MDKTTDREADKTMDKTTDRGAKREAAGVKKKIGVKGGGSRRGGNYPSKGVDGFSAGEKLVFSQECKCLPEQCGGRWK